MDTPKANGKKEIWKNGLAHKEFSFRDSLLTELFKNRHIRTIYNMFVALLFVLFLNTILYDYLDAGKFSLDFEMIRFAFGKPQMVLTTWVVMNLCVLVLLYPCFYFWSNNRLHFAHPRLVDYFFLLLYVVFLLAMFVFPVKVILNEKIPPASTMIILAEQIRLMMKSHAFIRENTPKVYSYKVHTDDDRVSPPCPDFGKFLYFLFAPTLIYRDEYPRTKSIDWRFVVSNFMNVVLCMFYTYYIFQRFCVTAFKHFGREHFTPKAFLMTLFGSMLPGTLLFMLAFFGILHSWMNAFAEMLQFGDRMFYRDWWNSTSFSNYYRTWNIIVHDWLYVYVYKDFHSLIGSSKFSGIGPMLFVFMLSAFVHEYIIAFVFGFFYPVLLVLFGGFGVLFLVITKKRTSDTWNVFMWIMIFSGTGILISLYSMEWYARLNCPPSFDSPLDYFIPRSWTCSTVHISA